MEPIKMILQYNMKPGLEEECHYFVVTELGPMLDRSGFRFLDAWYTEWGEGPQILGSGLFDSANAARELLLSSEWREALDGLRTYADNISVRLIAPAATFQL